MRSQLFVSNFRVLNEPNPHSKFFRGSDGTHAEFLRSLHRSMLAMDFAAYGLSSVKKLGADRGMIERNDLRSRLGRTSSADPTFETYEPKTDSEYDALMAERRGLPA